MSIRDRKNKSLERQLEKQIEENLRLRQRIEELNRELGTLHSDNLTMPVSPAVQEQFRRATDTQHFFSLHNYLSYLLARLHATSVWGLWQKLLTMARRYRLLTTTLPGDYHDYHLARNFGFLPALHHHFLSNQRSADAGQSADADRGDFSAPPLQ